MVHPTPESSQPTLTEPHARTPLKLVFTNPEDPMNSPITIDRRIHMWLKNTADRMTVSRPAPAASGSRGIEGSSNESTNVEVLATRKHALIGYDSVQFRDHYDGKTMKMKNWLKLTKENGRRRWTMDTPIGELCWIVGAIPNRDERFLLVSAHNLEHRIAWVKITAVNRDPFIMYISEGSEAIHDIIMMSFGVVEEVIRMKGLDDMARRAHLTNMR